MGKSRRLGWAGARDYKREHPDRRSGKGLCHLTQPGQREGEGGPAGVMGSSGRPPVAGSVQQLSDPSPSLFMGLIYFYPPLHSFS